MPNVDMSVTLAGVTLKNPVVVASGTFGFGREYNQFYDLGELGGICAKGLTLHRREGNPAPRIAETPMGILNSVGLQNFRTPGWTRLSKRSCPSCGSLTLRSSPTSPATPRRSTASCARSCPRPEWT